MREDLLISDLLTDSSISLLPCTNGTFKIIKSIGLKQFAGLLMSRTVLFL